MTHAILLLWHKDITQLEELISFFDDNFLFYIHLDKKSQINDADFERLKNHPLVSFVSKKYEINWGGFNILKAELFLLKEIISDKKVNYVHFMSAQDYPIKDLHFIKNFFEYNNGIEFIEYMKLPNENWEEGTYDRFHYFRMHDFFNFRSLKGFKVINFIVDFQKRYNLKRKIPNQYDYLYGGSNWMSITIQCAQYIVLFYKKSFYNRLKYTFAPEETFFPTVIMNSQFKKNVKNDNLRYILWEKENGSYPAILDNSNWGDLVISPALFARKFDQSISKELKERINNYLLKKEEVKIESHGCWLNKTYSGHFFDASLAEGLLKVLSYARIKDIADFGCGPGWYVYFLRKFGYDINGYDGNPNIESVSSLLFQDGFYCQNIDLCEELTIEEPFDLVMSLEVGEHIPQEYEEIFFNNLAQNSNSYILLSWAVPNQGGDGHVNCHTNEYVIKKMQDLRFSLNVPISNYLREKASLKWFHKTIMFFQRNI